MPSQDFSAKDSGPLSIDFARGKEATLDRIRKILSTKAPIGGVVLNKGDLGNAGIEQIKAILEEIKSRGLLLIDATGNEDIRNLKIAGLPRQKADIVISKNFNAEKIQKLLEKAETIAYEDDYVLIVAEPKPVVLLALKKWVESFDPPFVYEENAEKAHEINKNPNKPFTLVPASMVVIE